MNKINLRLQQFGITALILGAAVTPTVLERDRVYINTSNALIEMTKAEFDLLRSQLKDGLQKDNKIDIMELYGKDNVKIFLPTINAELKRRKGKFSNINSENIINDLLSP